MEGQARILADLEALYRETGNPLYAWKAFAEDCPAGAPLPAWVEGYLRGCAAHLLGMAEAQGRWAPEPDLSRRRWWRPVTPGEAASRVSQALGLTSRGRNAFSEYRNNQRSAYVALLREGRPRPPIKQFMRTYGVKSAATVHDWIDRARKLWDVQRNRPL